MLSPIPAVVGLALVDSINPSSIGVTSYLLLGRDRYLSRVMAYLAGVFCTYLTVGCLLVLGVDVVSERFRDYWYSSTAYLIEGVIGALMLVYSCAGPKQRPPRSSPASHGHRALFLLGVGISVLEFSTALPYLGAITLIVQADLSACEWLTLMVLYNAVMAVPPMGLVVAYSRSRGPLRERVGSWRQRTQKGSRSRWSWIVGIIGFLLLADSLAYFDFLGFVDVHNPMPTT